MDKTPIAKSIKPNGEIPYKQEAYYGARGHSPRKLQIFERFAQLVPAKEFFNIAAKLGGQSSCTILPTAPT
jgi:hypothetical protein